MIARAYLRVSTQEQARGSLAAGATAAKRMERSGGVSLDTQRAQIEAYAAEHGYEIVAWYRDVMSGTRDERPDYQRLLREVAPGETILVARLDRIGRRMSERFRLFEWCKERGVGLVPVTQPEMANEMARHFLTVVDGIYIEQLRERVLPGMLTQVERGKWVAKPPRWYEMSDTGTLIPAPDFADAQRAFEMVLRTGNIEATAAVFGINTHSLRFALKNRAYLGETVWNGITIPDTHPAIVRRETFDAVQAMRARRRGQKRRERQGTALLTGFIYVKDTPERLYHYVRRRRTQGVNRYYVTKAGNHTPYYAIRAEVAERIAVDHLKTLTLTPDEVAEIERGLRERARDDPHKRERVSLARKLAALDAERVATNRMEAQRRITPAEADRMRAAQERERAGYRARLDALPAVPGREQRDALRSRVGLAERIERVYAAGDTATLRLLVEAFVARVEVWGEPGRKDGRRIAEREVRVLWSENVLTQVK